MAQARESLISLSDTPWYHCVNRCVRRAYLCGEDAVTGVSYEHRRGWIADKIKELAAVFAIDVAAYAVMSNHYHVVVRVDRDRAMAWTDDDVVSRWTTLFKGPLLGNRSFRTVLPCRLIYSYRTPEFSETGDGDERTGCTTCTTVT